MKKRNTQTTTYVEDSFKNADYKNGLELCNTKLPFTNWAGTTNDLCYTKAPKKGTITVDKIYPYFSSISGHIPEKRLFKMIEFNFVLDKDSKINMVIPDLPQKINYYYEPTEQLNKFDEAIVTYV